MKKPRWSCIRVVCVAIVLLCGGLPTAHGAEFKTLRGGTPLDGAEQAPDVVKWMPESHALPRNYLQQPPLVPHQIDSYKIDLRQNKCLTCHSWNKARETRATKISITHFRNRFGTEMSDVSPQRYFCTQCHVPQRDAPPLVDNTFKPVDAIM